VVVKRLFVISRYPDGAALADTTPFERLRRKVPDLKEFGMLKDAMEPWLCRGASDFIIRLKLP